MIEMLGDLRYQKKWENTANYLLIFSPAKMTNQ